MSDLPLIQDPAVLRNLAQNPSQACTCALKNCLGWSSITETQWPQAQLPAVASLRDPDVAEPTFEEHHPQGTRYGDPQAPVSLAHFPTNRCMLHACRLCGQHVCATPSLAVITLITAPAAWILRASLTTPECR